MTDPSSVGLGADDIDEEYTAPEMSETTPEEDAMNVVGSEEAGEGEVAAEALAGEGDSAELSDAEAELAERTVDLQRVTAEYANYRKRTERDRIGIRESAKAEVVTELLPLRDDLDLADQHGDLTGQLKALADKLDSVFSSLKVEVFGAEGDTFDPALHEAVQDTSSGDEKVLGAVLRKGYRMGDRTLRTAMTIIADPQ